MTNKNKDSVFVQMLKERTNIDVDFIDVFFKKFKIGGELDFNIKDKDVAKYLGIALITLRNRLNNAYSKKKMYIEHADFVRIRPNKSNGVTYMLNYKCFERLAMNGDSEQSETVRLYFSKLREFITDNQHSIYQAVVNKDDLGKYEGFESMYFFAVDERKVDFKTGSTIDIVRRLRNYNVGRIKEVDLKYYAIVKNAYLIEKCLKFRLKSKQVIKNREIFHISPKMIKKTIDECYCKYVPKNKNDEMYRELSNLLGMYIYTKNKTNIKPFVIIDEDINAETL